MIAVALKGLLGRKTRAILTALAIVLGTGMVSATFIFTDTLNHAFNGVFSTPYEQASVVVSGKQIVTGAANTPSVPASLVARIKTVPGVEAASGGFLFATVKLVGANGKAIGNGGPQFGFGVDPADKRFTPLALTTGRWPSGPGEIAIGAVTAAKEHLAVGDTIGAKGTGHVHHYTITGLAEIPGVSSGSATLAAFDVSTAQVLLGKQGRYDSISVVGSPDVTPRALAARIRPLLSETETVRTSAAEAASVNKSVTGGISGIKYILLAFGGIALFVGAFVIFNTISMTVAQRTRELATLRTLGASRRQVLRSVLLESAVIGALASLFGLVLGLGLFKALETLFTGLPQAGTVFSAQTVVVTIVLGTGITLLAGLFPALRATRVPPIAAVREGAVLPVGRFHRYKPYVAGVVIVLAVLAIAAGVLSGGGAKAVLVPAAGGMLLLFIGVAMISSRLVAPLIRVVGVPARRLGGSMGRLASANSGRNPSRTAATAAALMIGLALVTFVAVLASGLETLDQGRPDPSGHKRLRRRAGHQHERDVLRRGNRSGARVGPRRHERLGGPVRQRTRARQHRFRQRHRRRHDRRRVSLRVEGRLGRRAHRPRQRRDRRLEVGKDAQAVRRQPAPGAGVERHQADVRRPCHLPPEVPAGLQRDPDRPLALRPAVPEPAERLRVRERRLGREPVGDRRAREVAPAVQRRDRPEHVELDQDATERHQDDARPSSTRSSRSP